MQSQFIKHLTGEQTFPAEAAKASMPLSANPALFDSAPRGAFAGQETDFKSRGIGQLNPFAQIYVMRGTDIPIENLLKTGVVPHREDGELNVLRHRTNSAASQCTSWSLRLGVAIQFGAGIQTQKNGSFNVVVAKLDGAKHDIAGPCQYKRRDYTGEWEATVAGRVQELAGFRRCIKKSNQVVCGDIYTNPKLSEADAKNTVALLRGQNVATATNAPLPFSVKSFPAIVVTPAVNPHSAILKMQRTITNRFPVLFPNTLQKMLARGVPFKLPQTAVASVLPLSIFQKQLKQSMQTNSTPPQPLESKKFKT